MYLHRPAKVGAGIGVFGALFILVTTTLLFIVPQELLSPTASRTYIETWSEPIMTVGGFIFSVGIPLVCVGAAYYLMRREHSLKSVSGGFVFGGLVFIVANALIAVVLSNVFVYGTGIEQSFFGHIVNSVPHGMRFIVAGLIGVCGGVLGEKYL